MFPTDIPLHCISPGDWAFLKTWKNQLPEDQCNLSGMDNSQIGCTLRRQDEVGGPNCPSTGGKPTDDFLVLDYTCESFKNEQDS